MVYDSLFWIIILVRSWIEAFVKYDEIMMTLTGRDNSVVEC